MNETAKAIDRITISACIIGILVMATALVVAVRGPSATAAPTSTNVEIELGEFSITGQLSVPPGDVSLQVTNVGTAAHNLTVVGGPATSDLNTGETTTLNLGDMEAGTYQLICSIAGHESAGMSATLVVGESTVPTEASGHAGHDSADYAAMDTAMTESILEFPAATEGIGNQILEHTVLADGTKQFESPRRSLPGK